MTNYIQPNLNSITSSYYGYSNVTLTGSNTYSNTSDITIERNGKHIKVATCLELIFDRLAPLLLEPDKEMLEKFPSLREAYNEYQAVEKFHPALLKAYENYKLVETLCKNDPEEK